MNSNLKTGHLIPVLPFDLFKGGDLDIPTKGIDLEKVGEELERTLPLKALDKPMGIKK